MITINIDGTLLRRIFKIWLCVFGILFLLPFALIALSNLLPSSPMPPNTVILVVAPEANEPVVADAIRSIKGPTVLFRGSLTQAQQTLDQDPGVVGIIQIEIDTRFGRPTSARARCISPNRTWEIQLSHEMIVKNLPSKVRGRACW